MRFWKHVNGQYHPSDLSLLLLGALLGLGASLFLLRGFIFSPGLAEFVDLRWPYSSELYPLHYLWDEFQQNPVPINHMLAKVGLYLFQPEVAERLIHIFIFTLMGMSMFFVTFKLTAKQHPTPTIPLLASTLASLFFIINPIVAMRMDTWLFLWYCALLPFLVYFGYTAFSNITSLSRTDIIKKAIFIALILLAMSPSVRMPYYFPFLLLPFLAAFSRPYRDYLKGSFLLIGLILVFYAVLSSIWILPMTLGSPSGPSVYVITEESLDFASTHLLNALSLNPYLGPEKFSAIFPLSEPWQTSWQSFLILIPIIAFSTLVLCRNRLTIWLAIFALAFILLTKGTEPPFGGFYSWLVLDSPVISSFSWQFRGAAKWSVPLMFTYAMLIGLAISSVLSLISGKIERQWLRRSLLAVAIAVFLALPLISGYPLLTGDLSGAMKPHELSSNFVQLNEWLEAESSAFKVIYYPLPPFWGSAKPTVNLAHPWVGLPYTWYWDFIDNALLENHTARYGELLAPWNTRYVLLRTGILDAKPAQEALAGLSAQEDLEKVKTFGPLYVFENHARSAQVRVTSHNLAVLGGLDNMISLAAIDEYSGADSAVIFLEQSPVNSSYLSAADILVSNQEGLDLPMSLLEDDYAVKPFEATVHHDPDTVWSKGTAKDLIYTDWHEYLEERRIENYQFDYDSGLVFTWAADRLDIPVKISQSGEYELLVRYLQNRDGGRIRIYLDGVLIEEIAAASQINRFRWETIGTVDLAPGRHTLTLENIDGFNAVNLLAVLPQGQMERYREQASYLVEDKGIIHIWEGESALRYSSATVSSEHGAEASGGRVLSISEGSEAWRDIDILRSGTYALAVSLDGEADISIDGQTVPVVSDNLGFAYLAPLYLDEGKHRFEIEPSGNEPTHIDVVWLHSIQGVETVADIFADDESTARVIAWDKINPTQYQVSVSASKPFMMAFAEAYHPMWVARLDGKEYQSVPLYSLVNGFWIEDTGELEITIEYKAQKWLYYGAGITLVSLAGAAGYLIWNRVSRKKSQGNNEIS